MILFAGSVIFLNCMEFVNIVLRTKEAVIGHMDTLTSDMAGTNQTKYLDVDWHPLVCHLAALQLLPRPVFLYEEIRAPLVGSL